jgi:DNA primase
LDFKFNWLGGQYDPTTAEGKSRIAQELLATIGRFKSEVAKYELTKSLAKKLNIPESVLLKQAAGIKGPAGQQGGFKEPQAKIEVSSSALAGQELLLALFLKDPAWVKAARSKIGPEDFSEGQLRRVVQGIWSLADEKSDWTINDLLLRLKDESAESLVTRLISLEEGKLGDAAQVFLDCIGKVQKEKQKKVRGRLIQEIQQAEVLQDIEKLNQLREQFNELLKTSG